MGVIPEELPENTLMWTQDSRPKLYGQWLAWQITVDYSIGPAEGVEPVEKIASHSLFKADVITKCKKEALEEARKDRTGLVYRRMDQSLTKVTLRLPYIGEMKRPVSGRKKVCS